MTVRTLMMFEEFWASRRAVLGITVRSHMMFEEFGRHGALPHDV